jgi:hypothetical protein
VVAAFAEVDEVVHASKNKLASRAPVPVPARQRAPGAGRKFAAPLLRQALYEWFVGIRYAIDWNQMIAENRSRGKKHLARFPRSVMKLKVQQLLHDYSYATLLNGEPVASFKADSWWFKRWEEEYGLSMRMANRKYAVPRRVVKERLEIFWVVLFRLRLFIALVFKYDALILNFDQSPYHHNETGSQNKPTLAIRGSVVPVVEGNSDVKSRWTANLTTQSVFIGRSDGPMPAVECMFKAEKDGAVQARLQAFHRSRGFPAWFSVTVGPKGSYREYDIIAWLEKHLETWNDGRDWRIYLCDDYSCHKTDNVWNLCWSRGYIRLTHGGGVTPVAQTPDTDLNEHVRRAYAKKESCLLLEKMKSGQVVPKVTHEECMDLMFAVVNDSELHIAASDGYKKVGQSIALHGTEDALVCREAGVFWNEETTDKFPSMRAKIDAELAAVADEFQSGGLKWSERDVKRLITPYPSRADVDRVLDNLGEDATTDHVHHLESIRDGTAVDEEQGNTESVSSDDDEDDQHADNVPTAVAGEDCEGEIQESDLAKLPGLPTEGSNLSAEQADVIHKAKLTMSTLE